MFVYSLIDPRDHSTFYVGITVNLYERFKQHLRCDGTNVRKDKRIQEIMQAGFMPIMHTIEQVDTEKVLGCEMYWISQYRSLGMPLTNILIPSNTSSFMKISKPVGRKFTNERIEELLRYYAIYGKFPSDIKVSTRSKYTYRHHPRLEAIRREVQAEREQVRREKLPVFDGNDVRLTPEKLTEVLNYILAHGRIELGI